MSTPIAPAPAPYAPVPPTNTKAILALVFSFVFWPVAIFLGHSARKEIRRTGESGQGLATAGLVLSYIWCGLTALILLVMIVAAGAVASNPPPSLGKVPGFSGAPMNAPGFPSSSLNAEASRLLPAAPPSGAGPSTVFGTGTYEVGVDIEPGTYKTQGANEEGTSCYWARHSDASGDFSALISNNIGTGPMTLTVKASDAVVETSGCQLWHKVR